MHANPMTIKALTELPKIIDIVKFNHQYAFVLDKNFFLTYEKRGDLLIGSDETQTFLTYCTIPPVVVIQTSAATMLLVDASLTSQ